MKRTMGRTRRLWSSPSSREMDGDEDDTEADKARSDSAIKTSKDDTEDTEAPPSRGY